MSCEKIFLLLFLPVVSNSAPWLRCPWEVYRQHLPWYRQTTPRVEAIGELVKAGVIIMVAHRTKTVQNTDQILVMDEGEVVRRGKHEQLKKGRGIYRRPVCQKKKTVSWKL